MAISTDGSVSVSNTLQGRAGPADPAGGCQTNPRSVKIINNWGEPGPCMFPPSRIRHTERSD